VDTEVRDGSCVVSVVDHGIGMPPDRLADENRRLVEREQLDVAPTSVLGLFVVGRLARRHGLEVELCPTDGGGVTARVTIPPGLYEVVPAPEPTPQSGAFTVPELIIPSATSSDRFSWFLMPPAGRPAITARRLPELPPAVAAPSVPERLVISAPAADPVAAGSPSVPPQSRGGLQRRVPGAQLADTTVQPNSVVPSGRPHHDAAAARAAFDGYQSGIANAAAPDPVESAGGPPRGGHASGLSRRVPGANMAPALRSTLATADEASAPTPTARVRDPDAEMAALDGFAAGLVRAGSVSRQPVMNPEAIE
jgi:hypothetical protein